jgi:hypothetical protein
MRAVQRGDSPARRWSLAWREDAGYNGLEALAGGKEVKGGTPGWDTSTRTAIP